MIAVDAMGGDFAPKVAVQGALLAAKSGVPVILFGDDTLEAFLYASDKNWEKLPITVEYCSQVIGMGDEPSRMVLQKKDSSLVRAMQAVADGKATAFFSAGNSGAILVAATLIVGRVDGVLRPAIGDFLPTNKGEIFCIDLGANTDAKPDYLEQFALMGHLYVSMVTHKKNPRIALLSNGHEPYKGSQAVKAAYKRLEGLPLIDFVGNLEPRDMFDDRADVLVCDGFVGNVLLKSMEGTAGTLLGWIKKGLAASLIRKLGAFLSKGAFGSIKKKLDYAQRGGSLLFGVRKPVLIGHGCSSARAIAQGIRFAHTITLQDVMPQFNVALTQAIKQQGNPSVVRKIRSLFTSTRS